MLQISSSGVSSVVPDETDKTVYCPLYKAKGKKKIALQNTILHPLCHVFATLIILQKLS